MTTMHDHQSMTTMAKTSTQTTSYNNIVTINRQ